MSRKKYKDGYYVEVSGSGGTGAVILRRDTKQEAEEAMQEYGKLKTVKYLGESVNGKLKL